jgi:cysteine-rich repeat protein
MKKTKNFRRFLAMLLSVGLVMGMRPTGVVHAADITSDFTDTNFLNCVSTALGTPGSVDDTAAAALTTLDCSSSSISNIAGIENLTGLTYLDLSDNSISNNYNMRYLVNLEELWASNSGMTSTWFAQYLTQLRVFVMDGNPIDGLSNLIPAAATLETLNIDDTNFDDTDVASVANLVNLTSFSARNCSEVTDLSPLNDGPNGPGSTCDPDTQDCSCTNCFADGLTMDISDNSGFDNSNAEAAYEQIAILEDEGTATVTHNIILPTAKPSDFEITITSPTTADLTWTDNSSDELGFYIYHAQAYTSLYDPLYPLPSDTPDYTTAANATSQTVSIIEGRANYFWLSSYGSTPGSESYPVGTCINYDSIAGRVFPCDPGHMDWFGTSHTREGNWLAVGATGVDEPVVTAGAVYMFEYVGDSWIERQKLSASDAASGIRFGSVVAMEGDYLVVGAPGASAGNTTTHAGATYVFKNTAGVWSEVDKLTASDADLSHNFGAQVVMEGTTIAIGNFLDTSRTGSVYIFEQDVGFDTWTEDEKIVPADATTDDYFSTAMAIDGGRLVVSSRHDDDNGLSSSGSVYVFEDIAGTWTQTAKIHANTPGASDNFGYAVSISGDSIAVTANEDDDNGSNTGSVSIFTYNAGTWDHEAILYPEENPSLTNGFGNSVSIAGDTLAVGAIGYDGVATEGGGVFLYGRSAGVWTQIGILTGPAGDAYINDWFGSLVTIDGDHVLVSESNDTYNGDQSGSIYYLPIPVVEDITTCAEITQPGIYTLTADLTGAPNSVSVSGLSNTNTCILVSSNNVTINLNGHSITETGESNSVAIANSPTVNGNITIYDSVGTAEINQYDFSIAMDGVNNPNISGFDMNSGGIGIYAYDTIGLIASDMTFAMTNNVIELRGTNDNTTLEDLIFNGGNYSVAAYSGANIDITNIESNGANNQALYISNVDGFTMADSLLDDAGSYGIQFSGTDNISITNTTISQCEYHGLYFSNTDTVLLDDVEVLNMKSGGDGLYISSSASNVTVQNSLINGSSGTSYGIFSNASGTTIDNVTIEGHYRGLFILNSTGVQVDQLTLTDNDYQLQVFNSAFTITDSTFTDPTGTETLGFDITETTATDNYTMSWATDPGISNGEYVSIGDKYLLIEDGGSGIQIDELVLKWTPSEITGEETDNAMFLLDSGNTWNDLSASVDTNLNTLTAEIDAEGTVGIFEIPSICGDSVQTGSEQCDDGNVLDGDGCDSMCQLEVFSFYVDYDTGTDNDNCTELSPCVSVNDAIGSADFVAVSIAMPTINIEINVRGTRVSPESISGGTIPGNNPVLLQPWGDAAPVLQNYFLIYENNITIDGFELDGAPVGGGPPGGFYLAGAENFTLRNSYVHDYPGVGISIGGNSDNVTVINNIFEGNHNNYTQYYCGALHITGGSENTTVINNTAYNNCVNAASECVSSANCGAEFAINAAMGQPLGSYTIKQNIAYNDLGAKLYYYIGGTALSVYGISPLVVNGTTYPTDDFVVTADNSAIDGNNFSAVTVNPFTGPASAVDWTSASTAYALLTPGDYQLAELDAATPETDYLGNVRPTGPAEAGAIESTSVVSSGGGGSHTVVPVCDINPVQLDLPTDLPVSQIGGNISVELNWGQSAFTEVSAHDKLMAFRGYLDSSQEPVIGAGGMPLKNVYLTALYDKINEDEELTKVFNERLKLITDGECSTGDEVGFTMCSEDNMDLLETTIKNMIDRGGVKDEVNALITEFVDELMDLEFTMSKLGVEETPFLDCFGNKYSNHSSVGMLRIYRDDQLIFSEQDPERTTFTDTTVPENDTGKTVYHRYKIVTSTKCGSETGMEGKAQINPIIEMDSPIDVKLDLKLTIKKIYDLLLMDRIEQLFKEKQYAEYQSDKTCDQLQEEMMNTYDLNTGLEMVQVCYGEGDSKLMNRITESRSSLVNPLMIHLARGKKNDSTDTQINTFIEPLIAKIKEEIAIEDQVFTEIRSKRTDIGSLLEAKSIHELTDEEKERIIDAFGEAFFKVTGAHHAAEILIQKYDDSMNLVDEYTANTNIFGETQVDIGEMKAQRDYTLKIKLLDHHYMLPKKVSMRINNATPSKIEGRYEATVALYLEDEFRHGDFSESEDEKIDLQDLVAWVTIMKNQPENWKELNIDGDKDDTINLSDAAALLFNWGAEQGQIVDDEQITLRHLLDVFGITDTGRSSEELEVTVKVPSWTGLIEKVCEIQNE